MQRRAVRRRARGRRTAAALVLALSASACANQFVVLEPPELDAVPRTPPEQTFVYDRDGRQLAVLRREFRERVTLDEVPTVLVDAVLAAEDRRFRQHGGVDVRAIGRAALANTAAGEVSQGGSTITQQLVKNLYMPDAERTAATKLEEALLARELEAEHDKDWILTEYLNTVYFGAGAYGVHAAAQTYYGLELDELHAGQAALLAGLIRSPGTLDPVAEPDAARARRDLVLDAMVETGALTLEEAADARARPLAVTARPTAPAVAEPHVVDLVVRTLLSDPTFGATEADRAARLYGGGLRIHTTIDPRAQAAARAAMAAALPDEGDPDAAVVTVDPATGHVIAAASSVPHDELQFDLATQGRRQPGSTFKTFVLTTAVTDGWRPDDRISGAQGRIATGSGVWEVRNADRRSYGAIRLEDAIRASVNGAFARLVLEVGPGRVAALAKAMGVASPVEDNAPIALGGLADCCTPLDMASAYATLAALGVHRPTTVIDRIEDASGATVWRPSESATQVVPTGVAWLVTQMLQTVVTSGTGRAAAVEGWEVAGKTGTVDGYRDAWFVGYTPTQATAVWVGHHEARIPMRGVQGRRVVTGGSIPAEIWRDHVAALLVGVTPVPFTLPDREIVTVEVDPRTGLLAAPWCPGEPSPVPRILRPTETCPSPNPPPPAPAPSPAPPAPTPTDDPSGAHPSETPSETPAEGPTEGAGGPASPLPATEPATSPPSP
jgi:membrane peptidoglycan carboxypeptidase